MKIGLELNPEKIIRRLFYVSLFFLAASLAVSVWSFYGAGDDWWFLTHNFDFDEKNNLPHAFKSLLLAGCGAAIFLNARAVAESGGAFLKRWRVLGWIFLALAVDEEVQIHQKTVSLLVARILGADVDHAPDAKIFWILPYLIFTAGFCVAYLGFWWKLPLRVRLRFAGAGIIYVGGAAVVEEIAHKYANHFGDHNIPYLLMTNFSEFMQMIGSILFIQALLLFHSLRTKTPA